MPSRSIAISILASLLIFSGAYCPVRSQEVDTVRASPNAVQLREIWRVRGSSVTRGDGVGAGIGALGDINGDSLADFAVRYEKIGEWRVYYGRSPAPSDTPSWVFPNSSGDPVYPVVGDFFGTGHSAVGFSRYRCIGSTSECYFRLFLFRTESGHFNDSASMVLDPALTMKPVPRIAPHSIIAADLDGDGADELLLVVHRQYRGTVEISNGEIWIYRGGPGFQVDSPTVIVRDPKTNRNDFYRADVADLDKDGYPDLITVGEYLTALQEITIYWGSEEGYTGWERDDYPYRRIILSPGYPLMHPPACQGSGFVDSDGDGFQDLLMEFANSTYVFRSGGSKSARTRPFTIADADRTLSGTGLTRYSRGGFVNDSLKRYETILLGGPKPPYGTMLYAFSGGPEGPDHDYDAYAYNDLGEVFANRLPVGDVNGDGWDDLLTSSSGWWGFNQGIALIFAGGPYIPIDSITSGVREFPIADRANAVSVWPNPVANELHIAWRGDLKHPPQRFEVHDMLGRRVGVGDLDVSRGEASWNCAQLPSGSYLLSLYGTDARRVVTTRILVKPSSPP